MKREDIQDYIDDMAKGGDKKFTKLTEEDAITQAVKAERRRCLIVVEYELQYFTSYSLEVVKTKIINRILEGE